MKHKLICWGDYAIPVDELSNWIAWDENGSCWEYLEKPERYKTAHSSNSFQRCMIQSDLKVPPPEPGPWHTQLYWIGD